MLKIEIVCPLCEGVRFRSLSSIAEGDAVLAVCVDCGREYTRSDAASMARRMAADQGRGTSH